MKIKDLILKVTGSSVPPRETALLDNFDPKKHKVSPFGTLPNVRSCDIESNLIDPLLTRYDIRKSLPPKLVFKPLNSKIRGINRYINRIMYDRLIKLLATGNHSRFWVLALMLMRRSVSLRYLALRQLDPNWHVKFPVSQVHYLMSNLEKKLRNPGFALSIHRIYAEKGDTFRPVGNPRRVDRMYLFIWQCFLMMFVRNYIGDYQHGFLPGLGTSTAWEAVTNKLDRKNIYEFDLKGAFPSVSISYAFSRLVDLGLPESIGSLLFEQNLVTVEHLEDLTSAKVPEPKMIHQRMLAPILKTIHSLFDYDQRYEASHISQSDYIKLLDFTEIIAPNLDVSDSRVGTSEYSHQLLERADHISRHSEDEYEIPLEQQGFPQGAGWSPILFLFVFEDAFVRGHLNSVRSLDQTQTDITLVAYADDFIIFCSEKISEALFYATERMKQSGLRFNMYKSKPLKINGF